MYVGIHPIAKVTLVQRTSHITRQHQSEEIFRLIKKN